MSSKFLNLSTDNTLGGNSPSDNKAVSEKAIKEYVDNNAGQTYVAGTGLGLLDNEFKVVQADTVTKNFTNIGNGSLDGNYNYTGASNSYLLLPNVIQLSTANSWEFQTTYKYNGGGSRPTIIGYYNNVDCKTPAIFYDGNAGIRLLASINGSSWDILTGGFTPVTNTTYNIKAGFTGSEYYLEYKTENETSWTRLSVQNSTKCYCSEKFILMNLGWNYSNYYSAGTMDLKTTKIIVNGSVVWEAVTTTSSSGFVAKATNSLYGLVKPDNASITVNDGVISSHITSSDVTTALGYTPYNSSNPAGYTDNVGTVTSVNNIEPVNGNVTLDIPTNFVTTDTAQDISGKKTFLGEKAILFKQNENTNKLGFTLYNPSSTELGAFEWRPSTIGGGALLNINVPYTSSNYVGFRYWGTAVNIIAPKVATAGNYYIPTHFTDGTNTVSANSSGVVSLSTLLPAEVTESTVSGWGFTKNTGTVTSVNNIQPVNGNVTLTIPVVEEYTASEVETLWESL